MTEAGRDSSQTGTSRDGGRLPGGFRNRLGQAWETRLRFGARGAAAGPESPPVPEPTLLPHEDIIETAKRRMATIKDGDQAALDRARQAGDSAGAVSSLETRVRNINRRITTNEQTLGNWETFCTNARTRKALTTLHDDVYIPEYNRLASRYNEIFELKKDRKTWYKLPRERQGEYEAEMALLDAQTKELKPRGQKLKEDLRVVPEDDSDITGKIARVKDLRRTEAELQKAEDTSKAESGNADKKATLEAVRRAYKEKQKALNRSNGGVDLVRWEAEQELIDLYLDGRLYEGLDEEVQERSEELLRGIEPEPNPSDVLADDELPAFLRREPPPVPASARRPLAPAAAVEARTGQPSRVDRRPTAPVSGRQEQGGTPVTPAARSQERGRPAVAVRPSQPASREINYNILFKSSRWEGAAQYAVSQLLAGVRPVTVENPGIPVLLRNAKVVLARMSAGMFTPNDADVIMHNRIFGDPRFSDELRNDLVKAWAQGTEVFGKNRLTKALGRVMYLMGSIGSIQTPDIFERNRFLRPIRRLMDSLNNNGISPNHILYTNEFEGDSSSPEQVPVRPQGRETVATVATIENVKTALGKYNSRKQLSQEEIAVLSSVNFGWPKGKPGADGRVRVQTPVSPARSAVPVAAPRARAEEAAPAISSAEATVTEGSIYRDVYGNRKLTEEQFTYIQAHRELLDDQRVNRAYTRTLEERQRRRT